MGVLLGATLVIGVPTAAGAAPVRAADGAASAAVAAATPLTDPTTPTPPPVETPPTPPAPTTPRVLRLGDTGSDVKAVQKLLGVKQTGTFNRTTRTAVKKVQRAYGIRPHGVVGPKTMKAIKKAAKARAKAAALAKARAKAAKARAAKARAASRSLPRAGSPAASQRYAKAYIAQKYGWGAGQFSCLKVMWNRESGWRYWASNPNGRYHGIPQTSSAQWRRYGYTTSQYMRSPAVQIRVGTAYIRSRYGTPCGAWSFWRSHHWY